MPKRSATLLAVLALIGGSMALVELKSPGKPRWPKARSKASALWTDLDVLAVGLDLMPEEVDEVGAQAFLTQAAEQLGPQVTMHGSAKEWAEWLRDEDVPGAAMSFRHLDGLEYVVGFDRSVREATQGSVSAQR